MRIMRNRRGGAHLELVGRHLERGDAHEDHDSQAHPNISEHVSREAARSAGIWTSMHGTKARTLAAQ
jgi:hypothetical protein